MTDDKYLCKLYSCCRCIYKFRITKSECHRYFHRSAREGVWRNIYFVSKRLWTKEEDVSSMLGFRLRKRQSFRTRLDRSLVFSSSWKRPRIINSRATSISREYEEGRETSGVPRKLVTRWHERPRPVVPH